MTQQELAQKIDAEKLPFEYLEKNNHWRLATQTDFTATHIFQCGYTIRLVEMEPLPSTDPYQIRIGGVIADPYRICLAYGLDPVIAQAVKKLLRCGRKHKDADQDVREAITTLERWEAIRREDQG